MTQPMPATRRQHWAQISEFGSVAGMRLLFSTCRIRALAIPHCALPGLALVHGHKTRGARLIDGLP